MTDRLKKELGMLVFKQLKQPTLIATKNELDNLTLPFMLTLLDFLSPFFSGNMEELMGRDMTIMVKTAAAQRAKNLAREEMSSDEDAPPVSADDMTLWRSRIEQLEFQNHRLLASDKKMKAKAQDVQNAVLKVLTSTNEHDTLLADFELAVQRIETDITQLQLTDERQKNTKRSNDLLNDVALTKLKNDLQQANELQVDKGLDAAKEDIAAVSRRFEASITPMFENFMNQAKLGFFDDHFVRMHSNATWQLVQKQLAQTLVYGRANQIS